MVRQEERAASSRAKLQAAARSLFVARGYEAASIDDIAAEAGLTKGAFYHHHADKKAIFLAVFEAVEEELTARVRQASRAADPWSGLKAGCLAFLDEAMRDDVQRVVFKDGPAVLGWDLWHEIDARYGLAMIQRGLELSAAAGVIRKRPFRPLALLLFGALCEAAREIGGAASPKSARRVFAAEIGTLLEGMCGDG
ncbi:MAG: TetR/AcrR family transcriptional regulator [Parvibaculum sp.]